MSAEPVIPTDPAPVDPAVSEPVAPPEPAVAARWSDGYDAELRDHPVTQRLDSGEAALRELIGVQKLIGGDKIPVPKEDWTADQFDDFYTKLGRPATAAEYDLSGIEIPEGFPADDGLQSTMVEGMHGLGLSQAQLSGVLDLYYQTQGQGMTEANGDLARSAEEAEQSLRTEWGKSYNGQVDLAQRALREAGGEKFDEIADIQLADGTKFGDNPAILKVLAHFGGRMKEHGLVGTTSTPSSIMTPEAATAKIAELEGDSKFLEKYFSAEHPEHAISVQMLQDLREMAG